MMNRQGAIGIDLGCQVLCLSWPDHMMQASAAVHLQGDRQAGSSRLRYQQQQPTQDKL
jgi:hypothetical protein